MKKMIDYQLFHDPVEITRTAIKGGRPINSVE